MPSAIRFLATPASVMTTRVTIFLLVWLLCASLFSFGLTDRIVAVVNKEVITWSDLQREIQDEYSRLKAKYRGEELERRYTQKQRDVLNTLIDERLQLQEAKAKGISVTQDEIDAALRRTPLPPTQTEKEFGQELLLKKLFDFEVRRNIVVEEEEIHRFYEANLHEFRNPPQYRLKQIFWETSNEYERTRATKKAQAIHADWKPETVLEDLAAQHTQFVSELGWVEGKDLLSPLDQAIKDLPPGTLSSPIQTSLGVHLLYVEDLKESQPIPFEQVEPSIRTHLFKQRNEEVYREWLKELKKKAFIDVKL